MGGALHPVALSDSTRCASALTDTHPADLGRDALQPAAVDRRHRGDCRTGHRHAVSKVLVDNTFASPALQQPLALGADIVLHSTTKYIGGHSDVVGGALVTDDEETRCRIRVPAERRGRECPGPFDAYLTMRGLKTLPLRMQRHSENAAVGRRVPGRATVRSAGCSTRVCPIIPGTTSPPGRCAASAA